MLLLNFAVVVKKYILRISILHYVSWSLNQNTSHSCLIRIMLLDTTKPITEIKNISTCIEEVYKNEHFSWIHYSSDILIVSREGLPN